MVKILFFTSFIKYCEVSLLPLCYHQFLSFKSEIRIEQVLLSFVALDECHL